jgi:hypothetical protein
VGTEEESNAWVPGGPPLISEVFPNPVSSTAGFSLFLASGGGTTVNVMDLSGRVVAAIHEGSLPAGSHSFLWGIPETMGNGIYFIRAETPQGVSVVSMTLLR